jgi:hypothetical protein
MTYAAHHQDFAPHATGRTVEAHRAGAARSGLLWRIVDAIFVSRQRAADRDIARALGDAGGRLTDEIEREMMQRLTRSDWSVRQ